MKTGSLKPLLNCVENAAPKSAKRLVYKSINDINGLHCACCSRPTLTKEKIEAFLLNFQLPSVKALKNKIFDEVRGTEAFRFIKKLSDEHPYYSVKKLIESENNKAAMSSLDRAMHCDVMRIMQQSKKIKGSASSFVSKFKRNKRHMTDNQKIILSQIEVWAKKYPGKSVSEILNHHEVKSEVKGLIFEYRKNLPLRRNAIFSNIKTMSQELNLRLQIQLEKLKKESLEIIEKGGDPVETKIKVKNLYKTFLSENCDVKTKEKIMSEVIKLDLSSQNPYKFFVNYSGCSDKDLADRLIKGRLSTFEHVKLHSKGGTNAKGNGSGLCSECNGSRTDRDAAEFIEDNPKMIVNAKKQVKEIEGYIRRKQLVNHDTYPIDIKHTYSEQTEGLIDIDVKEYCETKLRSLIKKFKKIKKESAEALNYKKQLKKQEKMNFVEYQKAESTFNKLKSEENTLQREINKLLDELGI